MSKSSKKGLRPRSKKTEHVSSAKQWLSEQPRPGRVIAERKYRLRRKEVVLAVHEPTLTRDGLCFCHVTLAGDYFVGSYGLDRLQSLASALYLAEVQLDFIKSDLKVDYGGGLKRTGMTGFHLTLPGGRELPKRDIKRLIDYYDELWTKHSGGSKSKSKIVKP